MAVHEVRFFGELGIVQAQNLHAWEVNAQFIAGGGVPATSEERSKPPPVAKQTSPGNTSAGATTPAGQKADAQENVPLSPFLEDLEHYAAKTLTFIFGQDGKE